MSYDLTIQKSTEGREDVDLVALKIFVGSLPQMKTNGERGFVYQSGSDLWMEIDLDYANAQGDSISHEPFGSAKVNRITAHIPAGHFSDAKLSKYIEVAKSIGDHLQWKVIDEQSGV